MPFDHDQIDNLDAVIDGLDAPSTLETWQHTDAYDAGMVAASAVRRALAGGAGTSPQLASVTLAASQVRTLSSAPVEIVAAPGAGKLALPLIVSSKYTFVSVPYGANADAELLLGADFFEGILLAHLSDADDYAVATLGNASARGATTFANRPLVLASNNDPGDTGAIATSTLGTGGSGYAIGDTGTVDAGSENATYAVTAVDGEGAVTAYTLTASGTAYAVADSVGTAVVTGGGDGALTINIAEITPGDGTLQVDVVYLIVDPIA